MPDAAVLGSRGTLRRATADDTPSLIRLAGHFIEGTIYGEIFAVNPQALEVLIALILTRGVVFVVDAGASGIIAMLGAIAVPHPVTGDLFAEEQAWWVEPEYRGTSVGPALMDAFEQWAYEQGARFAKVAAPAGSSVGTYYARRGYRPIEIAYGKVLHGVHYVGTPGAGTRGRRGGHETGESRPEPVDGAAADRSSAAPGADSDSAVDV